MNAGMGLVGAPVATDAGLIASRDTGDFETSPVKFAQVVATSPDCVRRR